MKVIFSLLLILAVSKPAIQAQTVPSLMNYQGRLTDEAAQPLPNGTYAVQFRLWNRAVANEPGEALVWGGRYDVGLVNGVFNVILGSPGGSALPNAAVSDLAFAFGEADRYLALTLVRLHDGTVIGEDQRREILPRQQLLSAPFALKAEVAARLVRAAAEELVPPGTIVAFGGTAVPDGWLLCDGSQHSRTDSRYTRLLETIGTRWGAGNGVTTFNLPDLRGVFLRGVNGSRSDAFADSNPDHPSRDNALFGGATGNEVGSFQGDTFRSHTHTIQRAGFVGGLDPRAAIVADNGIGNFVPDYATGINPSGGDETRPKNAYVHYIIKY